MEGGGGSRAAASGGCDTSHRLLTYTRGNQAAVVHNKSSPTSSTSCSTGPSVREYDVNSFSTESQYTHAQRPALAVSNKKHSRTAQRRQHGRRVHMSHSSSFGVASFFKLKSSIESTQKGFPPFPVCAQHTLDESPPSPPPSSSLAHSLLLLLLLPRRRGLLSRFHPCATTPALSFPSIKPCHLDTVCSDHI